MSRFFLNLFVSVEESGFLSVSISLSLVWSCVFLPLCVLVTDFLISLSWYISPWSLSPPSFPSLCFSLSLGPFQPLRTESSSLLIQVELGSGPRECPLCSHFLVKCECAWGRDTFSLLSCLLAVNSACPSAKGDLTQTVLEPSPSSAHSADSLVK